MTKNTLGDLHNALFEQLERLRDCEEPDELKVEVKRAQAMTNIAAVMVNNANTMLNASKSREKLKDSGNKLLIGE